MEKTALIVMADGFEDIEAVAPIDVLTRAGVKVTIASLRPGAVHGAYGSVLLPHKTIDQVDGLFDAIIFPGGRKNAESLAHSDKVIDLAKKHFQAKKLVAAICAAPSHVLAEGAGLLKGRQATGDPGFNDRLAAAGAKVTNAKVTVDGNLITAMGPGAAMEFALALAEKLVSKDTADQFASKWQITR
jgi:protein deglycase